MFFFMRISKKVGDRSARRNKTLTPHTSIFLISRSRQGEIHWRHVKSKRFVF